MTRGVMYFGRLHFLQKTLRFNSSFYCPPIRTCSDLSKRFCFDEMVTQRRAEAQRSLVVQISSKASYEELYGYCSRFAKIRGVHHYKNTSEEHFMLIEFDSEDNLKDILQNCGSHQKVFDVMAIPSPFVWFRAVPGKTRKNPSNPPQAAGELTTIDGNSALNDEELYQEIMQCTTVSDQIQTLYARTMLNELGVRLRYMVARQLEVIMSSLYANVAVHPFGSSVNGFGRMGCDLDLVLTNVVTDSMSEQTKRLVYQEKKSEGGRGPWQRHMELISELLELRVPGATRVQRILHARVPIVKYNHEFTDVQCDLGYNNVSGLYMSELLWLYGSLDKRVWPLAFTVRRWAQAALLTNPHPGRWITNFPLTLMVLFFLQQKHRDGVILPTFNCLVNKAGPEDARIAEDGINCTFLRDLKQISSTDPTQNPTNLEQLLFQFFEFYAQFDFSEKAISVREGQPIRKLNNSPLYIVNPLEPALNVSRNVSYDELERIRSEVRNAAWQLESVQSKDESDEWGILALIEKRQSRGLKKLLRVGNSHRLVSVKDLFVDDDKGQSKQSNSNVKGVDENSEKNNKTANAMKNDLTKWSYKVRNSDVKFKNTSVASAVYSIRRRKLI